MAGLVGHSLAGVGPDIVEYLKEAARFFEATIYVTSGYRSPQDQAKAMLDNWLKLKRGHVYKAATLPPADRERLDGLFDTSQSIRLTLAERARARDDFLALAKERVGTKSRHSSGRAVDVRRAGISPTLYKAITLHLAEIKEGDRKDIYHFESSRPVPPVDEAIRDTWAELNEGAFLLPAVLHGPSDGLC